MEYATPGDSYIPGGAIKITLCQLTLLWTTGYNRRSTVAESIRLPSATIYVLAPLILTLVHQPIPPGTNPGSLGLQAGFVAYDIIF